MNRQRLQSRLFNQLLTQAGDREAVDRLLEEYQGELYRYLKKILRNEFDAEDALQQAMMQAVRKLRWLRDPAFIRPWMFRIASRIAFRMIRQRQCAKEFSNASFIDEATNSEWEDSEMNCSIEQIPEWLERLTPKG